MEGIITETVITLETVFKRGETAVCANLRKRNVDVIIPTPQGFMLSVRVIQALSVLRLIMNIGTCQEPLPTIGLLADHLE